MFVIEIIYWNNCWNYLWLKLIVEIIYDWSYLLNNYYDDVWSQRMTWLIWLEYHLFILFLKIIYELEDDMNLTTWLCKGPRQWGHIRWQLIVLRVYVASETNDMSPERSATNHQRDQRFQRTWLPDDSQPTASRYTVLWPCHRDNVVIVMVGKKNLRNWWI